MSRFLFILLFPLSLKAGKCGIVWNFIKQFGLALVDPDTVMFSELGDYLANPTGDREELLEHKKRQLLVIAAEKRREKGKKLKKL